MMMVEKAGVGATTRGTERVGARLEDYLRFGDT